MCQLCLCAHAQVCVCGLHVDPIDGATCHCRHDWWPCLLSLCLCVCLCVLPVAAPTQAPTEPPTTEPPPTIPPAKEGEMKLLILLCSMWWIILAVDILCLFRGNMTSILFLFLIPTWCIHCVLWKTKMANTFLLNSLFTYKTCAFCKTDARNCWTSYLNLFCLCVQEKCDWSNLGKWMWDRRVCLLDILGKWCQRLSCQRRGKGKYQRESSDWGRADGVTEEDARETEARKKKAQSPTCYTALLWYWNWTYTVNHKEIWRVGL